MTDEETNVFELDEDGKALSIKPLVSESYDYENIINNPIIKPIAETDRSNRDLTEMVRKKVLDAIKDKAWLNSVIGDIPEYSDSPFITKLIKLADDTQHIIKIQDLKNRNLQNCIREMVTLVRERYGVLDVSSGISQKEKYVEPEEKIPFGGYIEYLEMIVENGTEDSVEIAKKILEFYKKDKVSKTAKDKFETASVSCYKDESNKKKRKIAENILRMELKVEKK